MVKNVLKRYSGIHELEKEIEEMNKKGWYIQSLSDVGNRILVIYSKEDIVLDSNNIQDVEQIEEEIISSNNGGTGD